LKIEKLTCTKIHQSEKEKEKAKKKSKYDPKVRAGPELMVDSDSDFSSFSSFRGLTNPIKFLKS
jgi:hypothetical protein